MIIFLGLAASFYAARLSGLMPGARAATTIQNSVPVTSVSAASFVGSPAPLSSNSIVAGFGTQLATGTQAATTQPLPTSLLNTTVTVNGVAAPLFFVSPNQINYLIPPNTPAGDVQVVVTSTQGNGDQIVSRGQLKVAQSGPAIFTANANGIGAPAAVTGRINANGQFVFDSKLPFEPDPVNPGLVIPSPIDVGTAERKAYLILYGTGLRDAPAGTVKAIFGGIEIGVTPVAAPGFTGLDQVNLEIPVSLKGRGNVDVTLVAGGVSSNSVTVNLAGTISNTISVSGFNVTDPALAGQTVNIQGAGFSSTPNQNTVRFGSAQARVIASSSTLLTVIVPFGAESSRVMVQTPQGEAQSTAVFRVRTSISGIVQSTGSNSSPPVPLEGVTIRLVGTGLSVRTNPQGSFVLADLPAGVAQIEVDGNTTSFNPPFPSVTLKTVIRADRDNQFSQPVSLQQKNGGSGNVGSGAGFTSSLTSSASNRWSEARYRLRSALNQVQTSDRSQIEKLAMQIPPTSKSIVISNRGVSLEVPFGASVRFPDGKTSGQMEVTVLEKSRLPGINLPLGVFSSAIAQITPLGSTFSPGASMVFPNPNPNLPAGSKVDLYRYDFQNGVFIKRGTATVSQDRTQVASDGRICDLASFWFVSTPGGITTVAGRVIDSLGLPVPGAKLTVNGRSDTSDQNGGFNIPDVATIAGSQIQVEAVLPQQYGTPPRGTSSLTNAVIGGVTNVGTIALSDTNQPGLVLSPFVIDMSSSSAPTKVDVTLTQPAPAGGLQVTLSSDTTSVATVPTGVTIPGGQTTASFNVTRVGPGVALVEARTLISGNSLFSIAVVTISRPAPKLSVVNPQSAPPGAKITISGSGFSQIPDNNFIGFLRNNDLIWIADPTENGVILDTAGNVSVVVETPPIASGPVSIAAAVIDDQTGVLSDPSGPINFTVLASDVPTPQLLSVQPGQGKPRDQVTINGSDFSLNADENFLVFRQGLIESEARILRATATSLQVEVPSYGMTKGEATIVARRMASNGASSNTSNALNFNITSDPTSPVKPILTSVINENSQRQPNTGRDGDRIRLNGTDFGRNFYDPDSGDLYNDDPLLSLILFYQNNELVNLALPTSAASGSQLTAIIPTGLAAGPAQISVITFDLESGFASEESNFVNFTITVGSLLRYDEAEPNESLETATDVFLESIIDGSASIEDDHDYIVTFTDGSKDLLVDLFWLTLDKPTTFTVTLNFTQTADLDLFIMKQGADGVPEILEIPIKDTGISEQASATLPAGDYLIGVGVFSGSSRYEMVLTEGPPPAALTVYPAPPTRTVQSLLIKRKK